MSFKSRESRGHSRASVSSIHFRRGKPFDDHYCRAEGELEDHFPLNAFGTVREPLEQIYRSATQSSIFGSLWVRNSVPMPGYLANATHGRNLRVSQRCIERRGF